MVAVVTARKKANDNAVDGEEEAKWLWKSEMYAQKKKKNRNDDDNNNNNDDDDDENINASGKRM